jgi:hypothetical protein
MMHMQGTNWMPFNNILYIGDEAKACIEIIEKFNNRLLQIEQMYSGWFNRRRPKNTFAKHDKLQYHIQYHFEGGIAVFKFRDEDELPQNIRNECLIACKNLAAEQEFYIS